MNALWTLEARKTVLILDVLSPLSLSGMQRRCLQRTYRAFPARCNRRFQARKDWDLEAPKISSSNRARIHRRNRRSKGKRDADSARCSSQQDFASGRDYRPGARRGDPDLAFAIPLLFR